MVDEGLSVSLDWNLPSFQPLSIEIPLSIHDWWSWKEIETYVILTLKGGVFWMLLEKEGVHVPASSRSFDSLWKHFLSMFDFLKVQLIEKNQSEKVCAQNPFSQQLGLNGMSYEKRIELWKYWVATFLECNGDRHLTLLLH